MSKKAKIVIVFLVILIVCLYNFYLQNEFYFDTIIRGAEESADIKEFKVVYDDKIKKGETKEFVLPEYWVGFACRDSETYEDVAASMIDDWDAKKSVLNADNTISVWLTQDEWEERVSKLEEAVNEKLSSCEDKNLIVEISGDMKKIDYFIAEDCEMSPQGWLIPRTVFMGSLFELQALTEVPAESCMLREVITREKDGVVIADDVSPGAEYSFTESEWYGTKKKGDE